MAEYQNEYGFVEQETSDGTACGIIKENLKYCMNQTTCVKKDRRTPRECLRTHDPSVPSQCHKLAYTFFECKRSLIDNRIRFRGPKGIMDADRKK